MDEGFDFLIFSVLMVCFIPVVLIGVIIAIRLNDKRISHSSWLRKIPPILIGVVVYLIGMTIIVFIGFSYQFLFICRLLLFCLGGYLAGRISRQNEVKYGLATGVGILIFSIFSLNTTFQLAPQAGQNPVWQLVLGITETIGLATLGGYFALIQSKRNQPNFTVNNETP